ncbi:unnamed protein product [Orchesella dallaii]|uniref:Uncharacterized protein n=1 Tax=Orchesella dallaii TaxID=48710 RepID=A0ABP1QJD7_9HEXA
MKGDDILNPHNNDEVVMQRVSLSPMPKLIYAFGYSTNDGDAFIRHSPFYVGHLPFVPNGNLPWPPCLPRQSNDNKDKNVFSNPNQTPSIKTSLNPHAREFIGVQGSKVRFNPDADEFSPGGVVFEDRLSSASTMHSWNEKIDKHEFYNEDTENDDGEPGVMIGTDYDSSALQLSDQHAMGSSGVGFYVFPIELSLPTSNFPHDPIAFGVVRKALEKSDLYDLL